MVPLARPAAAAVSLATSVIGTYLIVPSDLPILKLVGVVAAVGGSSVGDIVARHYIEPWLRLVLTIGAVLGFFAAAMSYTLLIESGATGLWAVMWLGALMLLMFLCVGFLFQLGGVLIDEPSAGL